MIDVTIPWKPKTKDRPRAGRNGRIYTPTATAKAEEAIANAFREALPTHVPIEGPISVTLGLGSDHIDLRIEPCEKHTHKHLTGDIDNLAKIVNDALNKVAWVDDRQIERQLVWKK